jgi:hypothetical protein
LFHMHSALIKGLNYLTSYDPYLLANSTSERSITHRLGMYYQSVFTGWDVDCEFNKNLAEPKIIEIDPRVFLDKMADVLEEDKNLDQGVVDLSILKKESISVHDIDSIKEQLRDSRRVIYDKEFDVIYFVLTTRDSGDLRKLIYPDIIVHKRGTIQNHIVIEAKKSTHIDAMSKIYDLVKLITLVTDRNYRYDRGYFIDLPVGSDFRRHKKFITKSERLSGKVFSIGSVKK